MESDDLDALVPPPAGAIRLNGETVALPVLTLAAYARARRFARLFLPLIGAPDLVEALEAEHAALIAAFAEATGIPAERVEAAGLDEQLEAFFALTLAVRDFTEGPLARALAAGIGALLPAPAGTAAPQTAPAGAPSSPGSAGAATA